MSDKFIKNITRLLEAKSNMSLKILLEKDENDNDDEGEDEGNEASFADTFDDKGEGEVEDEGEDEGEDEVEGEDEDEGEDPRKSAAETLEQLKTNFDRTNIITADENKIADEFKVHPEKVMALSVPSSVGNPIKAESAKKNSIKRFVILEEEEREEREEIEDILNDYQDQIDGMEMQSYKNLKNKESGALVDVALEVENALNYIENFDSHFKKSEIVYDWFVDMISSTAAANKKEETLRQFKDALNEKLPPEDKIGIQEEPATYNAMAGAKPTA
jgi:hypothetical protein